MRQRPIKGIVLSVISPDNLYKQRMMDVTTANKGLHLIRPVLFKRSGSNPRQYLTLCTLMLFGERTAGKSLTDVLRYRDEAVPSSDLI